MLACVLHVRFSRTCKRLEVRCAVLGLGVRRAVGLVGAGGGGVQVAQPCAGRCGVTMGMRTQVSARAASEKDMEAWRVPHTAHQQESLPRGIRRLENRGVDVGTGAKPSPPLSSPTSRLPATTPSLPVFYARHVHPCATHTHAHARTPRSFWRWSPGVASRKAASAIASARASTSSPAACSSATAESGSRGRPLLPPPPLVLAAAAEADALPAPVLAPALAFGAAAGVGTMEAAIMLLVYKSHSD